MKNFLIPLATAIAALLHHQSFAASNGPTEDVPQRVATLIESNRSFQDLDGLAPDPVASLILSKVPVSVERVSHRSHRSHSSHRSHRSGR